MKRFLRLLPLLSLVCAPPVFAGTHVWSGAVNGYWNNAGNWSSGGVPSAGEAELTLSFPAGATRSVTTNNLGSLTVHTITLSGDNYTLRGNSTLTFMPTFGLNILCSGANNVIDCPLSLGGAIAVSIASGDTLTIADTIGGAGSLNKLGDGTLRLSPPSASPNNFSGGTMVNSGLLDLNGGVSPSVVSVPGPLTIGSTNMALAPTVRLLKANQIGDAAVVTIHPNGTLLLNGNPDHIGSLTMIGGSVYTDTGTLHLNGNLTAGYTPLINGAIAGKLALNSAVRTITVSNGLFAINASIADGIGGGGGGILKTGLGELQLGASNSFSGPVVVSEGALLAQNSWSLGTSSQSTTVSPDAILRLIGGLALPEALSLDGKLEVLGPNSLLKGSLTVNSQGIVDVLNAADTLTLSNNLSGAGTFVKEGPGAFRLTGLFGNVNSGAVNVQEGSLLFAKPAGVPAIGGPLNIGTPANVSSAARVILEANHQIPDAAALLVENSGELALNNFSETIGPLTMRGGKVTANAGVLTFNGNVAAQGTQLSRIIAPMSLGSADRTFSVDFYAYLHLEGSITGGAPAVGLVKEGPGLMKLYGLANTYGGITHIKAGALALAAGVEPGSTSAGTIVGPGANLTLDGPDVNVSNESLTLNGFGPNGFGAFVFIGSNSWSGPITLATDTGLFNNSSYLDRLTLGGPIVGPGGLQFLCDGTVAFTGSMDNTYAGATWVKDGKLELGKSGGGTAVPGPLTIGTTNTPNKTAFVLLKGSQQIANSSPVAVLPSGKLDLNGFDDSIGLLELTAGTVQSSGGVLTLLNHCVVHPIQAFYDDTSFIDGRLSLGGSTQSFTMEGNCALSLSADVTDGGGPAGLTKLGTGGLWLSGHNTYSGPTVLEAGITAIYSDSALGATSAGTTVHPDAVLSLNNVHVGSEFLSLAGNGPYLNGALLVYETNSWAGDVTVADDAVVDCINPDSLLSIGGVVGGITSLSKTGPGSLMLNGTNANTLSGALVVKEGELQLSKTNANAISGPLHIGNKDDSTVTGAARLVRDHQISEAAPITIYKSGWLFLDSHNDTIGALTMYGGGVQSVLGALTLASNVTARLTNGNAYINGKLRLNGPARSFDVSGPLPLKILANISDGASISGLIKTGTGFLELHGSNSYSGLTLLNQGTVDLYHSSALGAPGAGTIMAGLDKLRMFGGLQVAGELLTVSNSCHLVSAQTNSWDGPIHSEDFLYIEAPDAEVDRLLLGGAISGTAPQIAGPGTVVYHGTADNTAPTCLHAGTLLLSKTNAIAVSVALIVGQNNIPGSTATGTVRLLLPNQIGDTCGVLVDDDDDLLDLNHFSDVIGGLSGSGGVALGTGTLTIGSLSSDSQFSGIISGTGSGNHLVKIGTGTLTLEAASTYTGKTIINAGKLYVDGSIANSAVTLNAGGTLGGRGQVGNVVTTGGIVSPGNAWKYGPGVKYGRLQTGSLNIGPGTTFRCEIGGLNPGVDCDQLAVNGSLILNNALLTVVPEFNGSLSNQFVIIEVVTGGAAMGSFLSLPEGTQFMPAAGRSYQITYFGGAGNNDVVLTQLSVAQPATLTGIAKSPLGPIQITGTGTPGVSYDVYANSTIVSTNWVNIGSTTADGAGLLKFIDADSLILPVRFYRFALP